MTIRGIKGLNFHTHFHKLNQSASGGEEIHNKGQFHDPKIKNPEDVLQAVVAVRRLVRRETVMRQNDVVNPHIIIIRFVKIV